MFLVATQLVGCGRKVPHSLRRWRIVANVVFDIVKSNRFLHAVDEPNLNSHLLIHEQSVCQSILSTYNLCNETGYQRAVYIPVVYILLQLVRPIATPKFQKWFLAVSWIELLAKDLRTYKFYCFCTKHVAGFTFYFSCPKSIMSPTT